MPGRLGHLALGAAAAGPDNTPTAFLFGGWFRKDPHADLAPEHILKRLHPNIQEEFAHRPRLRRGFEQEMRLGLKRSRALGEPAVQEWRNTVDSSIAELNKVVEEEAPEHLEQLLKHAEQQIEESQQPTPLHIAQRLGLASTVGLHGLAILAPGGCLATSKRRRAGRDFL
ncbi:hypothetical protein AK812_SmicGene31244 [Symbiodinium microadriaticum]|uniref:Uncharacterized protein n=1 Tax=Symbiodinium microadriaticum TaxID=2951 RepID=A0A1Q9CX66_SYMMI|nr:hypothetical protein AK812_SmicGene31244 [Symbiodinium microadriaticum]CAE7241975.1 unnamed protein product [Symbiodinium sp. KB8]CAE7870692.1 unnamed protein product [Symbiodinium microadriaticum]